MPSSVDHLVCVHCSAGAARGSDERRRAAELPAAERCDRAERSIPAEPVSPQPADVPHPQGDRHHYSTRSQPLCQGAGKRYVHTEDAHSIESIMIIVVRCLYRLLMISSIAFA